MDLYEMYSQTVNYMSENYELFLGAFLGAAVGTLLPEKYNLGKRIRRRIDEKRAMRSELENKLDSSSLD